MSAPGVIEAAIHAINACAELTQDERVSARVLVALHPNVNIAQVIAATTAAGRTPTIRRMLDVFTRTTAAGMR